MPIYAFACGECGEFEVTRPVAQAAAGASCPACGAQAQRVFTPPGLALLARPIRRALDGEEKSAHEPDVVSEKRGRPLDHHHHHHHHTPAPPWVLSH
jgi:putative FmdB family regulatory protein